MTFPPLSSTALIPCLLYPFYITRFPSLPRDGHFILFYRSYPIQFPSRMNRRFGDLFGNWVVYEDFLENFRGWGRRRGHTYPCPESVFRLLPASSRPRFSEIYVHSLVLLTFFYRYFSFPLSFNTFPVLHTLFMLYYSMLFGCLYCELVLILLQFDL